MTIESGDTKVSKIALFCMGFLLYANTIPYKYALDDKILITENEFTKRGVSGFRDILTHDVIVGFFGKGGKQTELFSGGRYRPVSHLTFAIEYELFGENPYIGHFINALLYGLTGILLFLVLCNLFPPDNKTQWYLTLPFAATAIFLGHPLHTEVVANIKGRDEILSFAGAISALWFSLLFLKKAKFKYLLYAFLCFFLSLNSKESAFTFVAITPLTIWFFKNESVKRNIIASSPFIVAVAIYFTTRLMILGVSKGEPPIEWMNDPFVFATASEKYASAVYHTLIYIKLLMIPHPLTHDYYPEHIPIVAWTHWGAIGSLLLCSALIAFALLGMKKKNFMSYCILYFFITFSMFSNILFVIGTMNERFMYIPSLGFSLALGYVLTQNLNKTMLSAFMILIFAGYSAKTISRNMAWENDNTLSLTDVKTSAKSAKVQMSAGLSYVDMADKISDMNEKRKILAKAIEHLNISLKIYPTYIQPMLLMGNAYYKAEDYNSSLLYYENCLKINPGYSYAVNNIEHVGDLCSDKGMNETAVKCYLTLLNYGHETVKIYSKLGKTYGMGLGDNANALKYLLTAYKKEHENTDVIQKLGVVYSLMGQTDKALELFNKGISLQPDNANFYLNIGIVYQGLGQAGKADEYISKAIQLDPSLKR